MVDGKEIGAAQTIDAVQVESFSMTRNGFGMRGFVLPKYEGSISMEKAEINMDAFRELFGKPEPEPTLDIEVTELKQSIPLPNGRKRLPKKKRLRKKWLKRYYSQQVTMYRNCTMQMPVEYVTVSGTLTL